MHLHASFSPLPPLGDLALRWQALESEADGSFFLGWTWTGSWLVATSARPDLLTIADDAGKDVALALVGRASDRRRLGRVPTLFLGQSGDVDADRPFIEYNGLLTRRGGEGEALNAAVRASMARRDWAAFRLSGVEPGNGQLALSHIRRRVLRDESPAYFIDLGSVREAGGDYLSLLSANSRGQIRRSFKQHGDAVVERADAALIDAWLDDMARLNTGRHEDNAWDHASFRAFASEIAMRGQATGEVELLRISCGGELTGYLLNFLYRGRAMNYQSAFIPAAGSKSKPGLMCHAAAVARYADAGLDIYSLLAGRDRYKQSLSTGAETLQWWTLERFHPALEAEALLRRLFRR